MLISTHTAFIHASLPYMAPFEFRGALWHFYTLFLTVPFMVKVDHCCMLCLRYLYLVSLSACLHQHILLPCLLLFHIWHRLNSGGAVASCEINYNHPESYSAIHGEVDVIISHISLFLSHCFLIASTIFTRSRTTQDLWVVLTLAQRWADVNTTLICLYLCVSLVVISYTYISLVISVPALSFFLTHISFSLRMAPVEFAVWQITRESAECHPQRRESRMLPASLHIAWCLLHISSFILHIAWFLLRFICIIICAWFLPCFYITSLAYACHLTAYAKTYGVRTWSSQSYVGLLLGQRLRRWPNIKPTRIVICM